MHKLDESLFEFAELDLKKSLETFINDNKINTMTLEGGDLNYYDVGVSDKTIMIIPSSDGSGDVFFRYIQELSKTYRVIVPFYRENVNLEFQYRGFIDLIKQLDIDSVDLLGYSFGGVLAQLIVKEEPDLVNNLILLDSETKTEKLHPKLIKQYIKGYKRLIRTIKYTTNNMMLNSMKRRIVSDVKVSLESDRHFWEAFYTQILNETHKERMSSIYKNVLEFWSDYKFAAEDFIDFDGEVTILNLEDSITKVVVVELSQIFDGAKEIVYDKTYRMTLVSCFEDILRDISNL